MVWTAPSDLALLALSQDCRVVAASDGHLYSPTGEVAGRFAPSGDVAKAALSADGNVVAYVRVEGSAFVHNLPIGRTFRVDHPDALSRNEDPRTGAVTAIAIGATGSVVAVSTTQPLVPADQDADGADIHVREVAWYPDAIRGASGKCVGAEGGTAGNGVAVVLQACDAGVGQRWVRDADGSVRLLGKCLDARDYGIANGTSIQLWDCAGSANQQWRVEGDGRLINPASGRCLDAKDYGTVDGTPLQLWDCAGSANQHWTAPPVTGPISGPFWQPTGGRPSGAGGGAPVAMCAAVNSADRVELARCANVASQRWARYADGTIRSQGRCMDAVDFGATNGTRIQVWDCSPIPGNGNQKWLRVNGDTVVGVSSGRCLDALDYGTAPGTPLQLWDCAGSVNQRFRPPGP